ncbi:HAD family hydrolase [Aquibacillus rhizosphaerae]|uniref:HAD family hydrolase n=1 Tax=Aquibacillus rhizosphaerae TaxID=3051431 RepID=A0ABT7L3V4_9BACI|nr:HAD family hydrolase [Aquibacillus sp. LR5S19]MDL4840556.1 HAD family hydrolase [Aquibacillus sp. LR5S19]
MDTIIFDVDDTLYDQALTFKKTYKKMFQKPLSEEELDKLYITSRNVSDALFDKCEAGEVSILDMQIRRITEACELFDIVCSEKKALEFQQAYLEEQQKINLFPEMEALLNFLLKENKQLALLTNGEGKHQSMKIKQLGLEQWIPAEHHFISGDLGHAKPDREVFHIIEEKLQLNKKQTVYIGDSFDNDIIGAKQVGWQAIWMNHRKRAKPEGEIEPDRVVYNVKELLEVFC